MKKTTTGSFGRFLRRIVLGSVMLVAATAWVVLGDNGLPGQLDGDEGAGAVDDDDVDSPCQKFNLPVMTNGVLIVTNRVDFNMPAGGSNGLAFNWPADGSNKVDFFFKPVAKTECVLDSVCTNGHVTVGFKAMWCCKPGLDCAVLYRGQWMALTNFVNERVTGCIIRTGCR